jgi:hypothetical protein
LKWYDGGGENESHQKEDFDVEVFFPLRMLTSTLFEETFGAFLFLPFFLFFQYVFSLFFLCSISWGF